MTDFTPGPWILEGPDEFGDYTLSGPGEALAIAAIVNGEMRRMGGKTMEQEANALLIAAATDLYAAAQALEDAEQAWANCPDCEGLDMPELCGTCFPAHDKARLMRRAALAKASGD